MPEAGSNQSSRLSVASIDIRNSVTTALSACVAYAIALAIGTKTGYWAAITALVVCQSEVGATVRASIDRLIGTAVGVLVGWATALIWHDHVAVFGVAILLTVTACNFAGFRVAGRLAAVALAIVVLVSRAGPIWHTALSRFLEVSLGVVVALVTTILIRPRHQPTQN